MQAAFRLLICAVVLLAAGCAVSEPDKKIFFAEVRLSVNAAGSVTHAEILRTDAPPAIQKQAVDAVRKWRFKPGPPASATRMIVFDLNDPPKIRPPRQAGRNG